MKLKVYQQGGGLIYTPFIPGRTESKISGSSTDSNGDDSKIDPLDKEILALMKDKDLLPSDIEAISSALIGFQRRTQHLGNPALGGSSDYRSVMPGMLQIMQMVSTARFNRQQWDNAVSEMQKHDAGSEVAMDSYGRMFVLDKDGKLSKISPNEYDNTKHHAISNSELLQYRERVAGMDGNLLNAMDDLVGKQDVYKAINEIIKAYGTQDKVAFLTKDKAAQAIILDLNSPDGIYNIKETYTAADLQTAFKVLYDELPTNMQHLLKANAALAGESNPEVGAYKFINNIIHNNISRNLSASFDASATKAAGGAGDSDDPKNLTDYNYVENLATGRNFQPPVFTTFNPGGSSVYIHAPIQNVGALTTGDGITPVGPGMVDSILESIKGLKAISPQYTVTFGDQMLDASAQGQLLYDGSALQRVNLPYKEVNGEITVDWETVEQLEEINKNITEKGATPGMIRDMIADNPKFVWNSETGQVEAVNHMWFLTFGAMIGHDFVDGLNTNSRYIERMTQDQADFWHKRYEEAAKYGFVNHDKNAPQRTNAPTDKGFLGIDWQKTKYYHGNVFMPILNEMAGAVQYYPKATHMDNMHTYMDNQRDLEIQNQVRTGQRNFNW